MKRNGTLSFAANLGLLVLTAGLLWPGRATGDSLNLRLAGSWPFSGQQAPTGVTSRNLCFVGSGGGVYVLDISNPASSEVMSDQIRTLGVVNDLFYEAATQRLYVSAELGGLSIWDVSVAASPVKLGTCNSPTHGYRVAVAGGFAYVADRDSGLRILDVSNPANPHQTARLPTQDDAQDIAVADTIAYLGDGGALRIINVANPVNPHEISYCDSLVTLGLALADSFIYVVNGYSGLRIVNVADPAHPVRMGRLPPMSYAVDVALRGHYAFIADNMFGYLVVDVADPWNPFEVASMGGGGRFWISVSDTLAFMLKDVVGIYDISDPPNTHGVGSFRAPKLNGSIAVSGDYAYVGSDIGLRVLSISDLQSISEVGSYSLGNLGCDIAVQGPHVYECNQMPDGLYVFDATDPGSPRLVGSCSVGDVPMRTAVSGSLACIAAQNSVPIVSIARPDSPFVVGRYGDNAEGITVQDSYIYTADPTTGLVVVSISDPAHPTEVGRIATRYHAWDVAVAGSYAYIADSDSGLTVISIAEPWNPRIIGKCGVPGTASYVAAAGNYAFIADRGLRVIDVSDPTRPGIAAFYDDADIGQNIVPLGRYVYTVSLGAGVRIYENMLQGISEESGTPALGNQLELLRNPIQGRVIELGLQVSRESDIAFRLFDGSGRLVASLPASHLSSGHHLLRIPVGNVAAGVYFLAATEPPSASLKVVVCQ